MALHGIVTVMYVRMYALSSELYGEVFSNSL